MDFLRVLVATLAAYAAGAAYYMTLSKPWLAATGLPLGPDGRPVGGDNGVKPFVIGFICTLLVAGMMRHVFAMSGLDTPVEGIMGGFGAGAFLITPWLVLCYGYSMRSTMLKVIDGGYAIIGCTIIGLVLTLF